MTTTKAALEVVVVSSYPLPSSISSLVVWTTDNSQAGYGGGQNYSGGQTYGSGGGGYGEQQSGGGSGGGRW